MFQTNIVEKTKARILGSVFFLNPSVCEIIWKNIFEPIGHRK